MQLPTSGAIAGIGTDIARVDRIQAAFERHGMRFVQRILGPGEQVVFQRRHARDTARGIRYLSTRFAAKEAFSKAVGLGMRSPMTWSRMETLNAPGGKPQVVLNGPLASWYAERFGPAHVSVSDEKDIVTAFVVVETLPA
jgi:holo-[acyl-carrier protein] synthase